MPKKTAGGSKHSARPTGPHIARSRVDKALAIPGRVASHPSRSEAKQETREALIGAAMQLFAAEGLDAPSLDAICEKAGFTRGAFYVHFKDRDDLLVAVMEKLTTVFMHAMLGARGEEVDVERAIMSFAEAVAEGLFPYGGAVRPHQVMAACARSKRVQKRYVALCEEAERMIADGIRAAQAARRFRGDVDAAALSMLLIGLVLGVETAADVGIPFDARGVARIVLHLLRTT